MTDHHPARLRAPRRVVCRSTCSRSLRCDGSRSPAGPAHSSETCIFPRVASGPTQSGSRATPGSGVKEHIGANDVARHAERAFVTLTCDPSFPGKIGGEPRDSKEPFVRVEDIRAAVNASVTRPFVSEERIGLSGSGYADNAALVEHRFKADGLIVGGNIDGTLRRVLGPAKVFQTLAKVGRPRITEARVAKQRRQPWIPVSIKYANAAGIKVDQSLSSVAFYRESAYRHPRSTGRLLSTNFKDLLGFEALHLGSTAVHHRRQNALRDRTIRGWRGTVRRLADRTGRIPRD